jgi:uncharacterized protein YecE (DUF72 family)
MTKTSCDIRIGTSGWHYEHWRAVFYPEDLPKSKWLEHYAKVFDTVEINNTFYQLPKEKTFENWHRQAPKDFLFTVKANRYITHVKKLNEVEEPLERFFKGIRRLKRNLGPVLYQLPPNMHKDTERLREFLKLLPKGLKAIFEFRHKSWFSEETYKLLSEYNVGFCVHDLWQKGTPKIVTGDKVYVRFHGTMGRYSGSYSKTQMRDWAKWLKEQKKKVRSIYVYFNNDVGGHAINNAKQLKEQLFNKLS